MPHLGCREFSRFENKDATIPREARDTWISLLATVIPWYTPLNRDNLSVPVNEDDNCTRQAASAMRCQQQRGGGGRGRGGGGAGGVIE